jgi:hypothetical protein
LNCTIPDPIKVVVWVINFAGGPNKGDSFSEELQDHCDRGGTTDEGGDGFGSAPLADKGYFEGRFLGEVAGRFWMDALKGFAETDVEAVEDGKNGVLGSRFGFDGRKRRKAEASP